MDITAESKDSERIAKEIAKTSESIRKKYRALKTGRMEEDIALERHFKPVIEPLKQIMESNVDVKTDIAPISTNVEVKSEEKKHVKEEVELPHKTSWRRLKISSKRPGAFSTPVSSTDDDEIVVFQTPYKSSVKRRLQMSEVSPKFGPLGQKYMEAMQSADKNIAIDNVYGVHFSNNVTMLGDKRFDMDSNDDIIVDGTRYAGTLGLYELIFMKIPQETAYTEADKENYKNILLATNAHRRGHNSLNPILGNKGWKYKYIIAPLVSNKKTGGKGLTASRAMMILNDNAIDYVHWNDPNELVDRLRLLEASRQAGNNAHDNEILSIIEELREAGLIIN